MRKSVLVTGSSRGIGKAIALRLAGTVTTSCCIAAAGVARPKRRPIRRCLRPTSAHPAIRCRRAANHCGGIEDDIEQHGCYYGVVCNAGVVRDKCFRPCRAKTGTW